jgi:flagellar protein FlaG
VEATMQIDPIASSPIVSQSSAIGTRNQTSTVQPAGESKEGSEANDVKLSLPPELAPDTLAPLQPLEEAVKVANISLNFSRDEETGNIVIKLVDQTSGETVQQIPSEATLHLSAALSKLQGQIFDTKA